MYHSELSKVPVRFIFILVYFVFTKSHAYTMEVKCPYKIVINGLEINGGFVIG